MALAREQASRRGTNASAAAAASSMPAPRSSGMTRPGTGRPTKRASSARHPGGSTTSLPSAATIAARIGRSGAVSPAESVLSVATSVGTKRKDRDFDVDGGLTSAAAAATASPSEETNINVVVRCRGRNDREVRENSAVVVTTDGTKGKTIDLSMGPNALSNKTYQFDRVFSPAADQGMVFDDVVKPILEEMLAGFNCTIFAYGQTGTGKTYTMSGDMTETLGFLSDAAGIIPRVLQSLFQKLAANDPDNSVVRCSFIELYNEELRDLLAPDDSTNSGGNGSSSGSSSKQLRIYDDNSRKGHATTMVQGMEERHIGSAAEGIKRLQEGSLRRQVAATKCNDLSSRSHTVFTITVQTKHVSENGEDFYSTGKLNLVDLAGSENIQRSGAENKRAAEAGLINKSLLTLGRVINALVDRTAHVPYRESKLTRLLQDSLGGRTKTCIIATISTAKSNLEETISTLDYAFRAKNIRNKPQTNQLLNKKTLLREFTAEIEKLKSELILTRQRHGVYLSNEAYEEMTVQSESRRILADEQAAKIETMEHNLRHKLQELLELTAHFMGLKKDHEGVQQALGDTRDVLDQTERVLAATRQALADETRVREAHAATEETLAALGSELLATLGRAVDDMDGLRAKNRRKSDLQGVNRSVWAGAQAQVADVTRLVEARVQDLRAAQQQHLDVLADRMQEFVHDGRASLTSTQALLDQSLAALETSRCQLLTLQSASQDDMDGVLQEIRDVREHIQTRVGESLQAIATAAERIAEEVLSELGTFHNELHSSYSSLGKDFKGLFEDMLKHMSAQRAESDSLRRQVEAMGSAAVDSSAAMAEQIRAAVEEERATAAEERQQLLAQIGSLIGAQAEKQQRRLATQADEIRTRMGQASRTLETGLTAYGGRLDSWNAASDGFWQQASQSRDRLQTRLQDDWAAASERSTAIQQTTHSVQAETVRVVAEQRQDLAVQMQGLDALVSRAAAQNADHRAQHDSSVSSLAGTVAACLASVAAQTRDAEARTAALDADVAAEVAGLQTGLAPVGRTLCQPLDDLRALVSNTALREYVPTGETPEKVKYQYPLELPRTAPHSVLLSRESAAVATPCKTPAPVDHVSAVSVSVSAVPASVQSVRDAPAVADESAASPCPSLAVTPPPSLAVTPPSLAVTPPPSLAVAPPPDLSLREVNPNLAGPALLGSGESMVSVKAEGDDAVVEKSSLSSAATSSHRPSIPTYRRSMRPPPQKQAKTIKSAAMADGRENMPPAGFAQGASRRRSPRLK